MAPEIFTPLSWREAVVVLAALFGARILALPACLWRSSLPAHDRWVAGWFGPKGFASVIYGLMILQLSTPHAAWKPFGAPDRRHDGHRDRALLLDRHFRGALVCAAPPRSPARRRNVTLAARRGLGPERKGHVFVHAGRKIDLAKTGAL